MPPHLPEIDAGVPDARIAAGGGPWRRLMPVALIVAGIVSIFTAFLLDDHDRHAWQHSVLLPDIDALGRRPPEQAGPGAAIPVMVRRLPSEPPPELEAFWKELDSLPEGGAIKQQIDLETQECVVLAELREATIKPILETGRAPRPGKAEALAGDLTMRDAFTLDGQEFQVVGRLARRCAALAQAYLVLDGPDVRPLFGLEREGTTQGYLCPDGMVEAGFKRDRKTLEAAVGGVARARRAVGAWTVCGLLLVASGGSWAQCRLLRRGAVGATGPFAAARREIADRPILLAGVHVLLYGVFFAMMLSAFDHPIVSLRLSELVQDQFEKGELSYIGRAYASGNVLRATAATFTHNFFVATLGLTILPSLIIPFAGVVKSLLSFAAVGFVMAPIWTGIPEHYVYHCITMTLEMEAYIIATFIAIVFPLRIARGLLTRALRQHVAQGLRAVISGAFLAAAMLAIAACYEATTLLLFHPAV